jgi:hypothetical protein
MEGNGANLQGRLRICLHDLPNTGWQGQGQARGFRIKLQPRRTAVTQLSMRPAISREIRGVLPGGLALTPSRDRFRSATFSTPEMTQSHVVKELAKT